MGTDSVRAGTAGAPPRRPAREHKRPVNRPLGLIATRSPRALSRSHRLGLRVGGAGLLAATAAIHLDLYLTGYRTIPTIGWLFLVQVITAFLLAAAVLARGSRIVAAAGAGFAMATLGGYLLSVWAGLFGFTEVRTTAGISAGIVEVACFAALAVLALAPAAHPQPPGSAAAGHGPLARLRAGGRMGGRRRLGRRPGRPRRVGRSGWRAATSGRRQPEDRQHRWRERAHQRKGLHPLLVRP